MVYRYVDWCGQEGDMSETERETTVDAEQTGGEARTPPYFAFRTFGTFLGDLKEHGIPHQIDRSALKRFPGGVISQLIMGCRSLGLTNSDNRPTQRLAELVATHDSEEFKPLLAAVLRDTYPYIFRMDLTTATPAMFGEAMKANSGAKGEEVQAKCRRFFLQAAQAAEIEIGKRLLAGAGRAPNGSGTKRKPKAAKAKGADAKLDGDTGRTGNRDENSERPAPIMAALLAKFPDFDPKWPDELKAKWFADFDKFMDKATGS
jgi:hypothetical protein